MPAPNREVRSVGVTPKTDAKLFNASTEMLMLLPLRRAILSSCVQSKTEMPEMLHWFKNCCPLFTLLELVEDEGELEPLPRMLRLALILLPLRAAMLPSWVQSAIETPVMLHWLTNCWPLLTLAVGVALADVVFLAEEVLEVVVHVVLELDLDFSAFGTAATTARRAVKVTKDLSCMVADLANEANRMRTSRLCLCGELLNCRSLLGMKNWFVVSRRGLI